MNNNILHHHMNLSSLSTDTLLLILNELSLSDLIKVAKVNKRFKALNQNQKWH